MTKKIATADVVDEPVKKKRRFISKYNIFHNSAQLQAGEDVTDLLDAEVLAKLVSQGFVVVEER